MPAAVGKGTGRTVAIGHQETPPPDKKRGSRRGASRFTSRKSGRK